MPPIDLNTNKQKTLVVIGGGAAGFFCAVNAARLATSLRVVIVEKSNKILSKVRASGGGRCNVTHACFDLAVLSKNYPRGQHFLKKAFHWFSPANTVEWFEERHVPLKTEADGRMFPLSDNSETIVGCLVKEANKYGVEILMNRTVEEIVKEGDSGFSVHFANAQPLAGDYICVACGGFSKATQFDWLVKTGHQIESPAPSLFTFNIPGNDITSMMGISVPQVTVKILSTKLAESGPLLITHWGLSGPVILKLSAWGAKELAAFNYHFGIVVNWLHTYNESSLKASWSQLRKQYGSQKIGSRNPFALPGRLWNYFLHKCAISPEINWADLSAAQQSRLIKILTGQEFQVSGKTTFKEEFVTCGGIKLAEIDVNSMQSKIVPGLFFAGEIMDVDGVTGGFNFQHAWTSGWLAAKSVAESANNLNQTRPADNDVIKRR
ncbi:MAG TPA: NAD(P)/FAD-dependent oxidoreductase [Panacibacter sp.]|nr:NAD(P)/FAD-dependent oxidoreductase [Panacibacter sp.]HNP42718.1 NAD(P)/FAD-dependent oxidoreductase [Panacibacter sp.]